MRGNFEAVISLNLKRFAPEEVKKKHIQIAREILKKHLGETGPQEYDIIVDGVEAQSEESVRPFGTIIYRFMQMKAIGKYALEQARALSPVESGRYKRSWIVLADRVEVPEGEIPSDAQELVITNFQPYARKIHTRGARIRRVPPGIVEKVRQLTQRRFKKGIKTDLRYIELSGAYVLKRNYIQTRRSGKTRLHTRAGSELTYPSVVITRRF